MHILVWYVSLIHSAGSAYYVQQPEIRSYWEGLFRKHMLDRHTAFNTNVIRATWSESARLWILTLQDVATKQESQDVAEVLIWATGPFSTPTIPDIPGLESFKGEVWHSAQWRHDVPLKGKRLAVIGNGCSAYVIQFASPVFSLAHQDTNGC
jgi:cation diffusion facilitator CzcD-associated flavoprotein CzcO